MSQPIISVRGVGKRYKLGQTLAPNTLRDHLAEAASNLLQRMGRAGRTGAAERAAERRRKSEFWALKDISFDVQPGEVVGIIGRNGAGKSTLLKVLSEITDPTEGEIRLRGRVASLLEVGTGFHQELTGRENVYMNGSILGMSKAEINRKFDEIVAFSGVEQFLDTPVKRYSSGMTVRLGFAIAAHLEPEILIVDEVLSVGDSEFQRKCLGKMDEVSRSGRTILFVSHNLDSVLNLCSIAYVMDHGHIGSRSSAEAAVRDYLLADADCSLANSTRMQQECRPPIVRSLRIVDDYEHENSVATGKAVNFVIGIRDFKDIDDPQCALVLTNERDQRVVIFHTKYHSNISLPPLDSACLTCRVPSLPLVPGRYTIGVTINDKGHLIERIDRAGHLEVLFSDLFGTGKLPSSRQGHVALSCDWGVQEEQAEIGAGA